MEDAESLAVVIPVYQGADTLGALVDEIRRLTPTFAEVALQLREIVLVHDGAIDDSASALGDLQHLPEVKIVWLSRNFGQHPATVAGIASTTASWVVTMDEDGLHNPADIVHLVSLARVGRHDLVYGVPNDTVPHPWHRNLTSRLAKAAINVFLESGSSRDFASFRLIDGAIARSLAAYYGQSSYLDVALTWVVGSVGTAAVRYRDEGRHQPSSGYNLGRLISHFRRMVVTSGVRPLRVASALGLLSTTAGLLLAIVTVTLRLTDQIQVAGWASIVALIGVSSGIILLVLGLVAEYLAVAVSLASGRPPYLSLAHPPRSVERSWRADRGADQVEAPERPEAEARPPKTPRKVQGRR